MYGQQEAEQQLMPLEQTAAHRVKQTQLEVVSDVLSPLLNEVRFLRLLKAGVEEVNESVQRV